MTTQSYAVRDSMTMLRRNLRHAQRYPGLTLSVLFMPVLMLLLFVYVLGGALGAGINQGSGGDYVDYLTPGIILLTITGGTITTAIGIATDMSEGIIARFRTMAISRSSVLVGHVVGSVIQALVTVVFVIGVALLIGFRPTTDPVRWLGVAGVVVMLTLALTWLSVPLGLISKNAEGASNIVMPLVYLPFLGSAFVPAESMSGGLRWFAENQPFTPIIETLRALLMDTPVGNDIWITVAWCVGMTVVGYVWGNSLYNRDPVR